MESMIRQIDEEIVNNRRLLKILVWSAGGATRQFLSLVSPQLAKRIVGVVDTEISLNGNRILDYTITSPANTDFSSAQAIIITSPVFHDEIKKQIMKIPAFRGQVIDLFDERLRRLGISRWLEETNAYITKNRLRPILFNGEDALLMTQNDTFFCFGKAMQHNQILLDILDTGQYEKRETDFVLSRLEDGWTMLDIGANIGWFAIHAAKRYPNIQIYAFEPSNTTYEMLVKNIHYNHVEKQVRPHHLAVGDHDGLVQFTSTLDTGNHIGVGQEESTISVSCTTLDTFAGKESMSRVDFIKCDIEGAELMMLKGALRLLRTHRPPLILEINESWTRRFGYQPQEIENLLRKEGYEMHVLDEGGTMQTYGFGSEKKALERNYIFLHKNGKLANTKLT